VYIAQWSFCVKKTSGLGSEPDLITLDEAAQLMSCHRVTIYRWSGRDGFPALIRVGRRATRLRRSELEDYLASRQPMPNNMPPYKR
jgi:excisionase family DNA binding protein